MRADKQARHDQLCQTVENRMEPEGQELHAKMWVLKSRAEWAALIGVSLPTLTELSKIPPLEKLVTIKDGKKVMGLRVMVPGEKPTQTHRDLANIMGSMFKKQTSNRVPRKQWGMLNGLAEIWPEGYQTKIFKWVISEDGWKYFNNFLKLHQGTINEELGKEQEKIRYYRHVSIPILRRYPYVASDIYKEEHFPEDHVGYASHYDYT